MVKRIARLGVSPSCVGFQCPLSQDTTQGGISAGVNPALPFIDLGVFLYPLPFEDGGKGRERGESLGREGSGFCFFPFLLLLNSLSLWPQGGHTGRDEEYPTQSLQVEGSLHK